MPAIKNSLAAIALHIKKDKKIILLSLATGLFITLSIGLLTSFIYARNIQRGIAENVLRLHVVANSNSYEDQTLKLHIRDGVLALMHEFLTGHESKSEVIEIIENNMPAIINRAENILSKFNSSYIITAKITYERFPTRHYEGISLPPGYYTALRINIGTAQGNNWWCIAFPPLCFVDATRPSNPRTPTLQNVLTAEQYQLVTAPESGTTLRARFRIVEFWQNIIR